MIELNIQEPRGNILKLDIQSVPRRRDVFILMRCESGGGRLHLGGRKRNSDSHQMERCSLLMNLGIASMAINW